MHFTRSFCRWVLMEARCWGREMEVITVFHDENFKNQLKEVGLPTLEYRFWPDGAEIVENDAVLLPR